jgi:hypothetical protein
MSWQDQADAPRTWQLIQTACLSDRSKLATRIGEIVERAMPGQGGDA